MNDITAIYYTANVIPNRFATTVQGFLVEALSGIPIISVSHLPMDLGLNLLFKGERSHFNIYRQALKGAKMAKTKYIALCEDDVLYSPEHFKRRPSDGKFAYNLACWSIFTWGEPMFTHKGTVRRNLNSLICERDLFIEAMEERFAKYPSDRLTNKDNWAEPGKYEKLLGVTVRETEQFYTNPPNVVFSHQAALGFEALGERKRLGEFRAYDIPYWGDARDIRSLYE